LCNRQIDSLKNSGFNTKPLLPKTNLKLSGNTLPQPQDSDIFLGKMKVFFPYLFHVLSDEEVKFLKLNEPWVIEIFDDS
jgi:hypothetical protein